MELIHLYKLCHKLLPSVHAQNEVHLLPGLIEQLNPGLAVYCWQGKDDLPAAGDVLSQVMGQVKLCPDQS